MKFDEILDIKVSIRDAEAMLRIEPLSIILLCNRLGFSSKNGVSKKFGTMKSPDGRLVDIPLDVTLSDYAARATEAIREISDITGYTELRVFCTLLEIQGDL